MWTNERERQTHTKTTIQCRQNARAHHLNALLVELYAHSHRLLHLLCTCYCAHSVQQKMVPDDGGCAHMMCHSNAQSVLAYKRCGYLVLMCILSTHIKTVNICSFSVSMHLCGCTPHFSWLCSFFIRWSRLRLHIYAIYKYVYTYIHIYCSCVARFSSTRCCRSLARECMPVP